jgi:DNA-3-methyladenine glycosylase II
MRPLDAAAIAQGAHELSARDPALARIVAERGLPPLWGREPCFATLLLIILEQQVSLASARKTFERLQVVVGELTPARLLALDAATLRAAGFSRQKSSYARGLAADLVSGAFDFDALATMDDAQAFARLVALHGVGPWSANIYLLMALRRPDVWPAGDLALIVGAQIIWELAERPTAGYVAERAAAWSPWRSVAARLLWSEYLARQRAGTLPRPNQPRRAHRE